MCGIMMKYNSMVVPSEVNLVAYFPLDVWDVLSHHYLSFSLLDEISLAFYGGPVDLFLVLGVVDLEEVLILLH